METINCLNHNYVVFVILAINNPLSKGGDSPTHTAQVSQKVFRYGLLFPISGAKTINGNTCIDKPERWLQNAQISVKVKKVVSLSPRKKTTCFCTL